MKNFLWKNGEQYDAARVINPCYFTGIIDFGTQKVKGYQGESEKKRVCKVEFQFPHIQRKWGDGTVGHHIKSKTITLSGYYAGEDSDMSNAELYDILSALGGDDIPEDKEKILPYAKQFFNKPLRIVSEEYQGSNGEKYDRINLYKPAEAQGDPDFEPHEGKNSYLSLYEFDQEDFDNLQPFHKRKIKKTKEYVDMQADKVDDVMESGQLPF